MRIRTQVCHSCIDVEEEEYRAIREVLREHDMYPSPGKLRSSCVLRMLEQGLIVNEQVNNQVKCGKCGQPAIGTTQRLCGVCLNDLDRKFYSEINEARHRIGENLPSESVHVMLNRKRSRSTEIDLDQL